MDVDRDVGMYPTPELQTPQCCTAVSIDTLHCCCEVSCSGLPMHRLEYQPDP